MSIPRQVAEAGEKVEEILKKMHEEPEEEAPETDGEQPEAEGSEGPEAAEVHVPEGTPEKDTEDYEHKFRVLQGKYNAEVPRLQQQLREMISERDQLVQRISALEAKPKEDRQIVDLSPDEISEYGEDFFNVIKKVVKSELGTVSQPVEQLKSRVEDLGKKQLQTEEEKFKSRLSTLVPGWEKYDTDQRFLGWLNQTDPFSGEARQALLTKHVRSLNADAVSKFFEAWMREAGVTTGKKVSKIERQVTPSSRNAAPDSASKEEKIITREEVAKFYADVSRGVYRNRDEEKKSMEANINAALREHRVR